MSDNRNRRRWSSGACLGPISTIATSGLLINGRQIITEWRERWPLRMRTNCPGRRERAIDLPAQFADCSFVINSGRQLRSCVYLKSVIVAGDNQQTHPRGGAIIFGAHVNNGPLCPWPGNWNWFVFNHKRSKREIPCRVAWCPWASGKSRINEWLYSHGVLSPFCLCSMKTWIPGPLPGALFTQQDVMESCHLQSRASEPIIWNLMNTFVFLIVLRHLAS